MEVKINREIRNYTESMFFGLSLRQLIFSALAGGIVITFAKVILTLFANSPPAVDPDAAAVSMVWSYVGELVFNMLILVGSVKMADHVVREMMGL